ncbi:MAG: helix-turn-helix domain-containing protein [Gammaproteobacteria bacterium]
MSAIEDLLMPSAYLRLMALSVRNPSQLVAGTGLTVERLVSGNEPITVRQNLACMRNAPAQRYRRDAHHRWAEVYAEHFHGPLTAAWLTAPTLGDGVDAYVRFMPNRVPYLSFTAGSRAGRYAVEVRPLLALGDLAAMLIEMPLLVLMRYVKTMRAGIASELVVEAAHKPVVPKERYRARFKCEFRFGRSRNLVSFPNAWRATPNPGFDAVIWHTAIRRCEETSVATRGAAIVTQVTRELEDAMEQAWGRRTPPTLEDMAQRLNLSIRSLNRRLSVADVSYQQLVDDVRKQRAQSMLASGRRPLVAIALDLGYQNAASFVRAYKRWFGTTPGAAQRTAQGRHT